ncbi:hypothetical protein XENOCAPTIV_009878, partial [Xenoophorus captivus]
LPPSLHLPYPDDTLALVVLSTPAMFERAFLPFLEQRGIQKPCDPVDQCVRDCVSTAVSQVRVEVRDSGRYKLKVDVRYDYELLPSRKPKALLVFEDVTVDSELVQPAPPDCVPSREDRIKLLEAFNFRWQDWSYRDIVPPAQTYSERQKEYFSTAPVLRLALLRTWGLLPEEEVQPDLSPDEQSQANGHG